MKKSPPVECQDAVASREESFDDIVTQLSQIVARLEQADLPLEQSLEHFERGVNLSRRGQAILDSAEQRVEQLLADGSLQPFGEDRDGKVRDEQEKGHHR